MNALEAIYEHIAQSDNQMSQRRFSRTYLGRSECYFAYLKSSKKHVSHSTLAKLYKAIEHRINVYRGIADQELNEVYKASLITRIICFQVLCDQVLKMILTIGDNENLPVRHPRRHTKRKCG